MVASAVYVSADSPEESFGDTIKIGVDVTHPVLVTSAIFPASTIVMRLAQHGEAIQGTTRSYADVRRKPLEFQVGDKVRLKVLPWKGVICFGKRGKLNPMYIGPFKVIAKIGPVSYRFELPQQLSRVHSMFHVSNLKKCLSDESLVIPLHEIQINDKLDFVEEPVEIMAESSSR
ncbi:hypothetical protein Tco_0384936 [Tanacetum coccineum]